jgi:hypothetical protein
MRRDRPVIVRAKIVRECLQSMKKSQLGWRSGDYCSQILQCCARCLDHLLHTDDRVRGKVVGHHNIPVIECGDQTLSKHGRKISRFIAPSISIGALAVSLGGWIWSKRRASELSRRRSHRRYWPHSRGFSCWWLSAARACFGGWFGIGARRSWLDRPGRWPCVCKCE